MPDAELHPDRVIKARADGICGLCGAATSPGQQIGRTELDGRRYWCHIACIRDRREAAEHTREGAQAYTSPEPVLLASRARTAAWPMNCALCPYSIMTGQRYAELADGTTAHVTCIAAAAEQAPDQET